MDADKYKIYDLANSVNALRYSLSLKYGSDVEYWLEQANLALMKAALRINDGLPKQ